MLASTTRAHALGPRRRAAAIESLSVARDGDVRRAKEPNCRRATCRRAKEPTCADDAPSTSRRAALRVGASAVMTVMMALGARARAAAALDADADALRRVLLESFDEQEFGRALEAASRLRALEPGLEWTEAVATISVDAKKFKEAVEAYDEALALCGEDTGAKARVVAGRALAYEGLYDFSSALRDYDEALRLAEESGFVPDPYVLNSRGNVRGSLGDWAGAREDFALAAELFQAAKGFRNGMSTTQRLDGAIYATSNMALADAQLGDEARALKILEGLVRRAPNSADVRAAAAALYYGAGRFEDAEDAWERACSRESGCAKYRDIDYVRRVRRWPPAMVQKLQNFLAVG